MKHITVVYSIPDDFDVSELTTHQHASAMSWGHKINECKKTREEVISMIQAYPYWLGQNAKNDISNAIRHMVIAEG